MTDPVRALEIDARFREGEALLARGAIVDAGRVTQALLDAHPRSARVHRLVARVALRRGDAPGALQAMARAVELAPDEADTRLQFGSLLAHAGRFDLAARHLSAAATLEPGNARAWHLLGLAEHRRGEIPRAREALARACDLEGDAGASLPALARLEFDHGFPADALPLWQRVLARAPNDVDARLKTGECLSRLGRQAEAAGLFRVGLEAAPDDPGLQLALGQALEDDGDRQGASGAYEAALDRRPGWTYPLACLLGLQRGDATSRWLEEAARQLDGDRLDDHDRSMLGYALGRALDARGAHADAMRRWRDANLARQRMIGPPDPEPLRARVEATIRHFDASSFRGTARGSDDPRPVFIVGMPRSGTTLTEQILARHPRVHGAGELPDMELVARRLPPDPAHVDQPMLAAAASRYLEALTRSAPPDVVRIVDKEPLNFLQLGWIARLFPHARVIWCRRDPRDVAISIYGENFALDETLATDFRGLGRYISLQHRLMRHWQAVLPLPIVEFRYEALVAEPEARTRALVDFAGLDWDPACLSFHRSTRAVQTPSRWQVREPLHARSVGRWRHYRDDIAPLLEALDDDLLAELN